MTTWELMTPFFLLTGLLQPSLALPAARVLVAGLPGDSGADQCIGLTLILHDKNLSISQSTKTPS